MTRTAAPARRARGDAGRGDASSKRSPGRAAPHPAPAAGPLKRRWWHRLLLLSLVAATVAGALVFGASSVGTWREQNDQRAAAEQVASTLDARIAELEAEIDRRTSEAGIRREALCFGPFVEPGTEVYAVVGLDGCLSGD